MKRSIFFLAAALVPVALGAQERGMLMEQTPGSSAAAERQGRGGGGSATELRAAVGRST